MNLTELKKKPIGELIKIAEFMGLEGMARNRKQDIIFAILKRHAMNGEEILVMVYLKFSLTVLASYVQLRVLISQAQTISMSVHPKFAVLIYVRVIPLQVLFVRQRRVNVILPCLKLTRLTMTHLKTHVTRFSLKT